ESLTQQLEEAARQNLGGLPGETLTGLLALVEEQAQQDMAQDDPANWARQALTRVLAWVGTGSGSDAMRHSGDSGTSWRCRRLGRAVKLAAEKVAEDWDVRLAKGAHSLMDHPGRRLAAAESALIQSARFCTESTAAYQHQWEQQFARTQQAWLQLEAALTG